MDKQFSNMVNEMNQFLGSQISFPTTSAHINQVYQDEHRPVDNTEDMAFYRSLADFDTPLPQSDDGTYTLEDIIAALKMFKQSQMDCPNDSEGAEDSPSDDSNPPPDEDQNVGDIREVVGARLIYKRQHNDGTFEEMWIYSIETGLADAMELLQNILAGTDIPRGSLTSEDGTQRYEIATIGDRQIVRIVGLKS